jgi:dolichol-phosphate mannosyltransferase
MNELSIIIPCLSSVDCVSHLLDELAAFLMKSPGDNEIVVVVNEKVQSAERVAYYVKDKYPWLKFEMLQIKGGARSYGALVRFGVAYSSGRYVLLISSRRENDLAIIPEMLNKIRGGSQVIQATRYQAADDSRDVPFKFSLYQHIYRLLTRFLLGFKVSDSTYGFKMFDRVFILALGLNQNGYSVCPEITFKALLAGGRVEYIASKNKSTAVNRDFKLYKEGIGYLYLLMRGFAHRIGVLWF